MTRVAIIGDKLSPTTKNDDGTTKYVPEGIFSFTTVFGIIKDNSTPKIVWTLAKDREEANLWTPVGGGEDDWPIKQQCIPYGIYDFGQNTGKREAIEESGVKIKLLAPGPIWICGMPYAYPDHWIEISKYKDKSSKNKEHGYPVKFKGVHGVFYYYLAEIIGEPQLCTQDGAEHQFRNVAIKTLTIEESFKAFKSGEMKAYDNLKEAFLRVVWCLKYSGNPFTVTYPENWAENEGLMERTWKDKFITF